MIAKLTSLNVSARWVSLLLIFALFLAACTPGVKSTASIPPTANTPIAAQSPAQPALDQSFQLKAGERADFAAAYTGAGDFWIQFDSVTGDSRCPADVQCVWAGEAVVQLQAQTGSDAPVHFVLKHFNPQESSISVGSYYITLENVDPYPQSAEASIPPEAYVITLRVSLKEQVSEQPTLGPIESTALAGQKPGGEQMPPPARDTLTVENGGAPLPPGQPPVGDLPPGDFVVRLMLFSHTRWHSIWAESISGGARAQVWFQQPLQSRGISGPSDAPAPDSLYISDGAYTLFAPGNDEPVTEALPDYILNPPPPPAISSEGPPPEPLGSSITQPMGFLIFPTAIASRPGEYKTVGKETVAGRDTYVLDYMPSFMSGAVRDRFWVDAQTGIILRWQNFSKLDGKTLTNESTITAIKFDIPFPDWVFDLTLPLPDHWPSGPNDIAN